MRGVPLPWAGVIQPFAHKYNVVQKTVVKITTFLRKARVEMLLLHALPFLFQSNIFLGYDMAKHQGTHTMYSPASTLEVSTKISRLPMGSMRAYKNTCMYYGLEIKQIEILRDICCASRCFCPYVSQPISVLPLRGLFHTRVTGDVIVVCTYPRNASTTTSIPLSSPFWANASVVSPPTPLSETLGPRYTLRRPTTS